ncbi:MAG: hypothetical protein PHR77_11445 [Kiritimatiellae bacterium]|nr:hypothetical protein [Kiritimatiellia bacterium]MDD5522070.1 hypothetical protein [Kiritimatiellia bacterium]
MKRSLIIATIVVTAWTFNSIAQDNETQGPSMRRPGMNQDRQGGRPAPGMAILKALDKNGDKVIDTREIANASAALKELDKNDDGKLTPDEIMPRPQRPDMEQGQGNREGRGQGQGDQMRRGRGQNQGDQEGMGNRQGRGGERQMGRGDEGRGQQGGPGREGRMRPPVPPFITALDANSDKVIDADEIANIPSAIKKLDKNGDGKLTIDELLPRPPRMEGEQGPEGRGNRGGGEGQGRGGDRRGPPPENRDI